MARWRKSEEKRQRNVKIVMGLFVAFIMVFSVFQLMVGQGGNDLSYSNFNIDVDPQTRMYLLDTDMGVINFYSHPTQIDHINMSPEIVPLLKQAQVIVVTFDPSKGSLSQIEQTRFDLSKYLGKNTVQAVTLNISPYNSSAVINCFDSRPFVPVVYLNVSSNVSIELQGGCIVVNANNTDFLIMRDRLLYSYFGVIQDG